MALIEPGHPAADGTPLEILQDRKKNNLVLTFELDKAILKLERQEIETYTIDTGQTTFTGRRVNLPEAIKAKAFLSRELQEIEEAIDRLVNGGACFTQVVPY
jgi:hypothetical protein